MKRILVTGGAGYIGKQTLVPLMERGYEVHVISTRTLDSPNNNVIFHHANLLDCHEHSPLINRIRPTHLLHSAWYTQNGKFWDSIENVFWLKASISLVEAFFSAGGHRLVGVGTCAEYDWNEGWCREGMTLEMPASLYGKIKKSTFDCLTALANFHKTSFAWARIFFPYGEAEAKERLIPSVVTNLLQGKEAKCTHGNQIRDFLHVNDIGYALAAVVDSEISGAINVASGIPIKIQEIVNKIALILNRENLVRLGAIPEPANSPPSIVANIDRLRYEMNWSPRLSLDEGLLRTIAWWRECVPVT